MILPDNLSPLPTPPRDEAPESSPPVEIEDFVSAVDVRRVLLGTAGELPVEGLSANDFDSFAGRADVPHPARSPFANGRGVELRVPDLKLEPQTIHPAFEVPSPAIRRAAPPQIAPTLDCEAGFGRGRLGERWWVIGMGLAAAAILMSGTLIDFISREAIRRSRATAPLDVIHVIPEKAPQTAEEQAGAEFAAKLERGEVE